MEKFKMETRDWTSENIEKIGAMFPNVITEKRGKDGELKKAINFEVLRQVLSEDVLEGNEAYEFTWVGKRAAMVAAGRSIRKTLRPCKEESKDWDSTENLYIEGDNMDVLKLLQESYLGKVKMIYIDPPYNTGHDFIYNDHFEMDRDEYEKQIGLFDEEENKNFKENNESNPRFHSDWCSMMYPRLQLARNLLSDDGVIFISIDDNEQENLIKVCNEVFGETNICACIPWQSRLSMQNDTDLSINHEYIIVYSKKRRFANRRLKAGNESVWYQKDSFVFRPIPLDKSKFDNPDNDPLGPWKADPFDAPNIRPNLTYPVINPVTGEQHLPPRGRHWRISQERFASAFAEGRIIFGKSGNGRPQMKSYYEEKKDFGSIDNSWFSGERVGTATAGTKELQGIFGFSPFDTPKPTNLIIKLIFLGFVKSGDVVIDFFSGSATTAHAVMQLNAEDGGKRKFIMVQLPELTDEKSEAYKAGYKTICEIGKERIRRAGEKIKFEIEASQAQLQLDEEPKPVPDIGFRVLKLADSNMKDVYYSPGKYAQGILPAMESNIKEDRGDLDLLFGCLLEWGLPLSMPYTSEEIDGVSIHTYNEGDLIACFAAQIPESVVRGIAYRRPLRAVFRDGSFASSPEKINVQEIFNLIARTHK